MWPMIASIASICGFCFGIWCEERLSKRLYKERLALCETSLSIWDNTRSSEYWLRYPKKNKERIVKVELKVRYWPFVESPGEFADRLAAVSNGPGGLLAGVRTVLIEQPPTISNTYIVKALQQQ